MAGWVLAADGSNVDVLARIVGVAGLVVGVGSASLTWYLWNRSGPALKVRVHLFPSQGAARGAPAELQWEAAGAIITNPGRMPAVVASAFLIPKNLRQPAGEIYLLKPEEGEFPVTLEPTGYCIAVLANDRRPRIGMPVRALAMRGDGRRFRSKAMQGTISDLPPRGVSTL